MGKEAVPRAYRRAVNRLVDLGLVIETPTGRTLTPFGWAVLKQHAATASPAGSTPVPAVEHQASRRRLQ